ncbi:hypothetical protein FB451DRAFT_1185367 [Mycena latifolia]|nr:hypothetical protein FB451DRAFT_1185367 [Mycena latifolia]
MLIGVTARIQVSRRLNLVPGSTTKEQRSAQEQEAIATTKIILGLRMITLVFGKFNVPSGYGLQIVTENVCQASLQFCAILVGAHGQPTPSSAYQCGGVQALDKKELFSNKIGVDLVSCPQRAMFKLIAFFLSTVHGEFLVLEKRYEALSGFSCVGPALADQVLNLRLTLTQRNIAGLQDTVYEMSTPGNARYGHYLTQDEELYGIPSAPAKAPANLFGVSGFNNDFANKRDLQLFLETYRPDMNPNTTSGFISVDDGINNQLPAGAGLIAVCEGYTRYAVATLRLLVA